MDHFPHDTNAADDDEKLEAFRADYGNDAYAFFFIMLEQIYRTENAELDITDATTLETLAKTIMVSVEKFHELLASALYLGLFSATHYDQCGVLTSKAIKRRAERSEAKRAKWRELSAKTSQRIVLRANLSATNRLIKGNI